jgi:uncharacterized protein (TIGR00725 family)
LEDILQHSVRSATDCTEEHHVAELYITADDRLRDAKGRFFDIASHGWASHSTELASWQPDQEIRIDQALRHVIAQGARKLPVGIVGPNDTSQAEIAFAEEAGAAIAAFGLPLVCGGRGGCMEAASRGCAAAGGLVIGILPSGDWMTANRHVAVPLASGLGEARNAIIASACFALIAVGGGHGTLSEMALGLKIGRLVIALPPALRVAGAIECATTSEAMDHVARRYLGLDA